MDLGCLRRWDALHNLVGTQVINGRSDNNNSTHTYNTRSYRRKLSKKSIITGLEILYVWYVVDFNFLCFVTPNMVHLNVPTHLLRELLSNNIGFESAGRITIGMKVQNLYREIHQYIEDWSAV